MLAHPQARRSSLPCPALPCPTCPAVASTIYEYLLGSSPPHTHTTTHTSNLSRAPPLPHTHPTPTCPPVYEYFLGSSSGAWTALSTKQTARMVTLDPSNAVYFVDWDNKNVLRFTPHEPGPQE